MTKHPQTHSQVTAKETGSNALEHQWRSGSNTALPFGEHVSVEDQK